MDDLQANIIARTLSPGQKMTIENMDGKPAVLGCSEKTAIRLLAAKTTRPALTVRTPPRGPILPGPSYRPEQQYHSFHLNADGLAVKAAIARLGI